tara:strand:- start:863 stop:3598 length:2736 start_codon:yes stop_codon:yes gene_type:complete
MPKFEDIKKANEEQKKLNKNLDDAVRRVGTMYTKYGEFSDKRSKEAKAYKKALDAQEKSLDTISEKVEDQKEAVAKIATEYKEQLKTSAKLKGIEKDITDFQKEKVLSAKAIEGFDQSSLLTSKAKEALEAGRVGKSQAILDIASLERDLMKEVVEGNLDLEDVQGRQAEIVQNLASEYELTGEEVDNITAAVDGQFNNVAALNEELNQTNALGISRRDILASQQEALSEQDDMLKKLKAGATKYIGVFSNGFLAFGAVSKFLADQVLSTRDLAKNLGVSQGTAFKLGKQTKLLKMEFAGMGMDFVEAQSAMIDSASDLSEVTYGNVKAVGIMSERYGVSVKEAANLRKIQLDITGGSEEAADALTAGAIALAEANNVAPGEILSDMATNSEEFARFGAEGAKRMALTAVATKKIGIEMASLVSASRGLLNIEESLSAEMEAEVMLGRELNLETARAAALQGDHLTVVKELAKQFGTVEDFQNLSVLQQEAAAAAAGLTVEEMTKMLANQDKITGLKGEELEHFKKTGELAAEAVPHGERLAGFAAENVNSIIAGVGAYGSMKQGIKDAAKAAKSGMGILAKFVGLGSKTPAADATSKVTDAAKEKGKDLVSKVTDKAKAKGKDLISKGTDKVKSAIPSPTKATEAAAGTSGSGSTSFMDKLGKVDMKKVLMGAAAMVVVAAAVYVFGKAVQEFSEVSWGDVGKAIVGMLALVGAVALLGAIMSSGVGAIAIIAGAAAMLIVAAAVYVLGKAIQEMAKGFSMMGEIGETITELAGLGGAFMMIAAGFAAMGIGLLPFAFGLAAITPFLGTLMALAAMGAVLGTVFSIFSGGEEEEGENSTSSELSGKDGESGSSGEDGQTSESVEKDNDINRQLLSKMDELISVIKQGGDVKLDGRKVGETMFLGRNPAGA